MRGSPVSIPNFIQICSYIIEKILENRQKRPNLTTPPVTYSEYRGVPITSQN